MSEQDHMNSVARGAGPLRGANPGPSSGKAAPDGPVVLPDPDTYIGRGSCGKKNCIRPALPQAVPGLPDVPIGFGGSGKPELDVRRTAAGTRVPWQYNNMVTRLPQLGWIVMRLDDRRPSTSDVDWRTIQGERVLTIASVRLYFRLYIPSLGVEAPANRALRLRLDQRRSTLRHFVFNQAGSVDLIGPNGNVLASLEGSTIEVTPARGLTVTDVGLSSQRLEFRVSTEFPDAGLIAWMVHNPEDNAGVIPVGEVRFGRDGVSRPISVPLQRFPSLASAEMLYIEAMSLYDARHLWAFAKAP